MKKTFFIAGGDLRQIYAAEKLSEFFSVCITGFDKNISIPDTLRSEESIPLCAAPSDYLLLPTPVSSDDVMLNAPFSQNGISISKLVSTVKKDGIVFGGKISKNVKKIFTAEGIEVIDYLDREEFSVLNAVPTAEGAIQLALEEMPATIYGSKILITGFGRISKILVKLLTAMGADVTVAARKYSDLAWAEIFGCKSISISRIEEHGEKYDIVYNTVPSVILGKSFFEKLNTDCLMIDLASRPGGIDFKAASELGIKVVWALGLPGKSAPVTSGRIIADTIKNILAERGAI